MKPAKPIILVSRCLWGDSVRYDGEAQSIRGQLEPYRDRFRFLPFCPEVGFGLPVPRPSMALYYTPDGIRLRRRNDGFDLTDTFESWLESVALPELSGAILKAKSPSCGLGTTKLYGDSGELLPDKTDGLFAALLRRRLPNLPIADETCFSRLLDAPF
ncbi:MAG: DUF523 domain-containing protein [Victivallaceae bacterium]|nr:DUF523 domain-containing protein [Victivallaceae bacterium]